MTVKYYKVIGADNCSCHGGDFDWTPYLPKGKRPGKWTPEIRDVAACKRGYHVTEHWNMWYEAGCRIFECEVDGVVVAEDAVNGVAGVVDKVVCKRIRLCKEIIPQLDNEHNTGSHNTGSRNTGSINTGDRNMGDYNTGNCNTGHYNTGSRNTGWRNTGNQNTGHGNTGHINTGNMNTGDMNTGHGNTGDMNEGDRNTGDRNTGHMNAGSWNSCNNSSGFFNTKKDTIDVFNRPCSIDKWEQASKPDFIFFALRGTMKESWRKAYDAATDDDKLLLVRLPNFDPEVFAELSGIRVDPTNGKEVL